MDNPMNASSTSSVAKSTGRISWPEAPSLKQCFSLPDSIMYYMAMNPSTSEVYNKLIQSCKYFFESNPILVARFIEEKCICNREGCAGGRKKRCCVKIKINKIKSKLWITQELNLDGFFRGKPVPNFIPLLTSKLFRCEIKALVIRDHNILFDDYKYLSLNAKGVLLQNVKMTHTDGKDVMLEEMLECVPSIEHFSYYFNKQYFPATAASFKNILQLKNLGNLKDFSLHEIPQVFHVADLSRFIEEYKDTKICIEFEYGVTEEYIDEFNVLMDTILESNVHNRMIVYDGYEEEKMILLESRYKRYDNKSDVEDSSDEEMEFESDTEDGDSEMDEYSDEFNCLDVPDLGGF
uniref:DUF38 domain-containing protein n=1 Tax=Panagrolaimus sp. ES5 TaxID=591445 RepID=A0AC34GXE4_9BILA